MSDPIIGYHANTGDGILTAIKNAQSIGASAAQIWLGNSKGYASKLIPASDASPVKRHVQETGFFLIAHSPYILNFARDFPKPAMERYVRDMINISALGGKGVVLHMGANTADNRKTFDEACATFVGNMQWVLDRVPEDVYIILENMAGGGTRMCCEMTPWIMFWQNWVPDEMRKRVRWCIDTAHLFAAGEYNITEPKEVQRFYTDFSDGIGWEYVLCIHFNGSKSKCGSHVDHHADIGAGLISAEGLAEVHSIAARTGKPLILETPCDEVDLTTQLTAFCKKQTKNGVHTLRCASSGTPTLL